MNKERTKIGNFIVNLCVGLIVSVFTTLTVTLTLLVNNQEYLWCIPVWIAWLMSFYGIVKNLLKAGYYIYDKMDTPSKHDVEELFKD